MHQGDFHDQRFSHPDLRPTPKAPGAGGAGVAPSSTTFPAGLPAGSTGKCFSLVQWKWSILSVAQARVHLIYFVQERCVLGDTFQWGVPNHCLVVGSPCTFTVLDPVWGFDFEGPGCQATDILEKAGNSPGRKWLRCRRPASVMPALMRL